MEVILSKPSERERLTFSDFYSSEFPRVYRAAWLLARDDDAALEATQEAFAKGWARWRRLAHNNWAIGWVITTALNEVRDRSRRRPRTSELEKDAPSTHEASFVDLRNALRKLPVRRREAIVLFYIGDLSVQAVAEAMNLSEGTVKAHLSQGRATLRGLLEVRDD